LHAFTWSVWSLYSIAHWHKLITHLKHLMYFSGLFRNVSVIEMNMFSLYCSWVSVIFPHVQRCYFLTDIPVQLCSTIYTSKLKIVNCGGAYRDCIKRNGDKTWMYSAHYIIHWASYVDNNNMTSMPCLIMQYKPYIVE